MTLFAWADWEPTEYAPQTQRRVPKPAAAGLVQVNRGGLALTLHAKQRRIDWQKQSLKPYKLSLRRVALV